VVARGKAGLQAMLLLGCLCLLYGPVLVGLGHMWWEHDRLDGFLIPLISLYMIWQKREELRNVQVKPATSWGLSLATLAGFLLVVGDLGSIAILQEISLITMIVGLVLLLLGKAFLKTFSLPIAYLCFAFSIIGELFGPLHRPFQLLTAKMAVTFLQMLGFPALAGQHYIVLPGMTLEVVKGCSGVTYLVSIIAIGLPLAYLTLRTWWSRVTLILSAVVIGIIANWARVVLIAIWAYLGGDNLHGPFHIFQGMFVAWAGYVMLFAGAWGL